MLVYSGEIPGEVVPYVRVGQERWTPRALRYHASRNRLRDDLALAVRGQARADGRLAVTLHFYRWRQAGDIDNLAKSFLDAGNGVLWTDDRVIAELHVYRHRAAKGGDRVSFSVSRVVDNSSPN